MNTASGVSPQDSKPKLLVVDDNETLCSTMQRAFGQRGYEVRIAGDVPQAVNVLSSWSPDFALLDLRLPGPTGLALIARLKATNPGTRVVMLTGYASIATAVEAIKLGADHYLTKPVDAEVVEAAFRRAGGDDMVVPRETSLSVHRLEWEHIHRILSEHEGNISATARALHMHRRTLQRKLNKHPVPG